MKDHVEQAVEALDAERQKQMAEMVLAGWLFRYSGSRWTNYLWIARGPVPGTGVVSSSLMGLIDKAWPRHQAMVTATVTTEGEL